MTSREELIQAHSGPTLEDWLKEEGFYEDSSAVALKRVEKWKAGQKRAAPHRPTKQRHYVLVRYGRPATDRFSKAS